MGMGMQPDFYGSQMTTANGMGMMYQGDMMMQQPGMMNQPGMNMQQPGMMN